MSEPVRTTFAELIDRKILEIGDGYRAKLDELGGDGPIFLRAGLVSERNIAWHEGERFRSHLLETVRSKLGQPCDTMVTTKGNSIGRATYVPEGSPVFVYSPHLSYWRSLDPTVLLPGFLRYWAHSPEFIEQLRAMGGSTDMAPYLSLSDQRRLLISLPTSREQQAIAEALSALDDKIAVNDRVSETGEKLAVCLAADEIWTEMVPLGNIVTQGRVQVSPEELEASVVAHYSLPAFDALSLPEFVAPASIKSSKFIVSGPSVLVSKLNPSVPRIWSVEPDPGILALASTEFLILTPIDGILPDEIWAVCSQPRFIDDLNGMATGTSNSHQRVKPADLLATRVVDPRFMEAGTREVIAAVMVRAREARVESRTLERLRNTLLPKLMSGEIRARDAEKVVEDVT